jgi:hypothetical protein
VKRIFALNLKTPVRLELLFAMIFCCAFLAHASAQSVTAAQVNGTWATPRNEFKIWALGHQRLQVEFLGTFEYKSPGGPMANTGEGQGIAMIEGNTATFKPDGAEDECRITLKFTHGKLIVTQTGSADSAIA